MSSIMEFLNIKYYLCSVKKIYKSNKKNQSLYAN